MKSESFPPEMLEYLQNLNWNGNIRELSNGIARYVLIGPEANLMEEQLHKKTARTTTTSGKMLPLKHLAKEAIKEMERSVILEALRANQWNRRKTAQTLKISYRALIYKIQNAGLVSRRTSLKA
jgi:two-component system response regulator AtoC